MDDEMRAMIRQAYRVQMETHSDLRRKTNEHRAEHGCTAYPSPDSALWSFVFAMTGARRCLEVGCGLGYNAAVLAEALGPDGTVDTIENDPTHADLAEAELAGRGLAGRVRVLRGDAAEILRTLEEPYDMVFIDGGDTSDLVFAAKQLVRDGGFVVSPNLTGGLAHWESRFPDTAFVFVRPAPDF